MAVYRQVHTTFWQDPEMIEYEPEEKYFYLYLMTNPHTTQCGIYEVSPKLMSIELGYPIDTVSILLKKFVDRGKILYSNDTKEVFLINWLKYNSLKSPKVMACVEKELKGVKNKAFLDTFYTLCIQYEYPIDTLCIDYGEEEEKEEEDNKKNKKNKKEYAKLDFAELVKVSPEEYEKLVERFGEKEAKERLINLDLYIGSTGKKYKSHYLTILNWDRMEKQRNRADPKQSGNVFFEILKEEGKM